MLACATLRASRPRPRSWDCFKNNTTGLVSQSLRPIRSQPRRFLHEESAFSRLRSRGIWKETNAAYHEFPISFTAACCVILFGVGNLTWFAIDYYRHPRPAGRRWPEPIATHIKRAEGHVRINSKPEVAMEYFKRALDAIEELGMQPTQQEVIELRFNIALFLEKFHQPLPAIDTIKGIRDDCQSWLKHMNRGRLNKDRTRILQSIVETNVRLGELYAHERVNDLDAAEEHFLAAVEMCVRETNRRETQGVRKDEGDWMSNDEMGATLEKAADMFEGKSMHSIAAPLYLRAITLSRKSCHAAVLMNNLAISLAQSLPDQALGPPTSRGILISNARAWAEKALSTTNTLAPPERTEECDVACAVATHNLGEFAEMEGLVEEARRKYVEAESLARVTQFWDGVRNAREGIRRLDKKVARGET